MYTNAQTFLLSYTTPAAQLGGVTRVHSYNFNTSFFRFLAQQVMQIIGKFTGQHFAPVFGTRDKVIFEGIDASRVAPVAWICHINSISISLDKRKISIILKKEVCGFPCHLYHPGTLGKETVPAVDYYGKVDPPSYTEQVLSHCAPSCGSRP